MFRSAADLSRELCGLWRMGSPRVAVVKIYGEGVSNVRIRSRRRFEERFLHIARQVSPLLEYSAAKKLFGFSHDLLPELVRVGILPLLQIRLGSVRIELLLLRIALRRLFTLPGGLPVSPLAWIVFGRFFAHTSLTEIARLGSEASCAGPAARPLSFSVGHSPGPHRGLPRFRR